MKLSDGLLPHIFGKIIFQLLPCYQGNYGQLNEKASTQVIYSLTFKKLVKSEWFWHAVKGCNTSYR